MSTRAGGKIYEATTGFAVGSLVVRRGDLARAGHPIYENHKQHFQEVVPRFEVEKGSNNSR
jgi:hypothetical protein